MPYELIEQDRNLVINGKKLSDKLPAGKSIRIPKGFDITKICGGGSGSVNMIIFKKETKQRFFMKYFHSADATLIGHNWKQQFNETVALINQQAGNIPLLAKSELQGVVDKDKAAKLSDQYRMSVYQLGIVVGFPNVNSGLDEIVGGAQSSLTDRISFSSSSNQDDGSLSSDSDNSLELLDSERALEHNLETSITRMDRTMENALVESTFALSEVAEGAEDLCDVISKPDADITQLVNVSKKYLEDMTKFQIEISSRRLPDGQY